MGNKNKHIVNWKLEPLTLDDLLSMPPHTIFKTGYAMIYPPQYEMVDSYKIRVKYVAIRRRIHDWAIYHSFQPLLNKGKWHNESDAHLEASDMAISKFGTKVHNAELIRELVPCTDEAFEMYRY